MSNITLFDGKNKKPFGVSAYPSDLQIDPCGYGSTEAEALSDLLLNLDESISVLQETKAMARTMLSERLPDPDKWETASPHEPDADETDPIPIAET